MVLSVSTCCTPFENNCWPLELFLIAISVTAYITLCYRKLYQLYKNLSLARDFCHFSWMKAIHPFYKMITQLKLVSYRIKQRGWVLTWYHLINLGSAHDDWFCACSSVTGSCFLRRGYIGRTNTKVCWRAPNVSDFILLGSLIHWTTLYCFSIKAHCAPSLSTLICFKYACTTCLGLKGASQSI